VHDDMGFVSAEGWGGAVVEPVPAQVLQGVVASLSGGTGVSVSRWRTVGVEAGGVLNPLCEVSVRRA
jgi:hypothetical protein